MPGGVSTNLFKTVKEAITAREAASLYGIKIDRHGMCICPFHNDHNPSMKIDDKRFHCFGCQADGDVINFTARLYQLSPKDAAIKLANDFGVQIDRTLKYEPKPVNQAYLEKKAYDRQLSLCYSALINYYHQMQNWKSTCAPKDATEDWDPRFVEAITNIEPVNYALDTLLFGSEEEKRMILKEYQEKGIPGNMKQANQIPIYYQSGAYAREHNELETFRASHYENVACKKDIEETISRNFDGMHLKQDAVSELLSRHDPERVKLVLASTIQDKDWDGRFSRSNKEWAAAVQMPDTAAESGFDRRYDYSVDTHPAVLDGFVSMFRKEISEREKSSILSSLHPQPKETGRPTKSKAQEACL